MFATFVKKHSCAFRFGKKKALATDKTNHSTSAKKQTGNKVDF
jgi:hypothetical protein